MNNKINLNSSESGRVLTITLILIFVIFAAGIFWVWQNLNAKPFTPVKLTEPERQELVEKLAAINKSAQKSIEDQKAAGKSGSENKILEPEPYSQENATREIYLTEKEINYFLNQRNLARRVAVDLSDDQMSIKFRMPVDRSIPVVGGTNIKLHIGTTLIYNENNLVIVPNGISVGGVPIPSAWWGGIKNQNLLQYFGGKRGAWGAFRAGVEELAITDGKMYVKLKE